MITIKKVTTAEQETAVTAIVKAFSADRAARWMYPDSQQYWQHFQSFVKAFAGAAFEHGSAALVDGYLAAALWLPPGIHPDEEAMGKLIRSTVPEGDQAKVSDELGDLIFAVVNIGRHVKADPEDSLRGTNTKFRRRFSHIEAVLDTEGETLEAASLQRMEEIWQAAKAIERQMG